MIHDFYPAYPADLRRSCLSCPFSMNKMIRPILFLLWLLFSSAALPPELRHASPPFISGDGFRSIAHFIYEEEVEMDLAKMGPNHSIFVPLDRLESFFNEVHPKISVPYILITHNGDPSAPGPFRSYLDDPKIVAWFSQNVEGEPHPKLHPLPIGIGNRYQGHGNPEFMQKAIDKKTPKEHLVYFNLTIQNHYEERWQVFQLIGRAPYCLRTHKKRFDHYLDEMASCKFVLAPRGVGLDTHRLWEALYLGSYPIVKSSSLDPLYEGLPVVVVNDWKEVTEEFLLRKYEELQQKSFNWEKLNLSYWTGQITPFFSTPISTP